MGETATTFFLDFLTKQVPVIIVMGLGIYFISKYFKEEIKRLNNTVQQKDDLIEQKNRLILDLTEKCITAFTRNTEAISDLKDEIRKQ